MPRRRWKLKDRREPLSPAMLAYLERGPSGLHALAKASRPEGYAGAVYFSRPADRAGAWAEYGEEITAAWIAVHPGTRCWAFWQYEAPAPRACLEGGAHVWPPGVGDWVWRQEFGLPGRPQARRPGAEPARLLFESQATYLKRLNLLAPGEGEQLTPEDFVVQTVEIPVLPELELIDPRKENTPWTG